MAVENRRKEADRRKKPIERPGDGKFVADIRLCLPLVPVEAVAH